MTPSSHPEIHDPERAAVVQRLDCTHRMACLTIADTNHWPSFTCAGCTGYVRLTMAERMRDEGPIIECLAAAFEREHIDRRTVEGRR